MNQNNPTRLIQELSDKMSLQVQALDLNMISADILGLALLEYPQVQEVLKISGLDHQEVRSHVISEVKKHQKSIETRIPMQDNTFQNFFKQVIGSGLDPLIQEIINIAAQEAQSKRKNLTVSDVFIHFMIRGEHKTIMAGVIFQKISRDKLLENINKVKHERAIMGGGEEFQSGKTPITNLNKLAASGKIDPIIGREAEIDRMIEILLRRNKNNPVLVGEPGVGKTALALGLALKIVNKEVPEDLLDAEIFSLDIGALVAGTKYRGDAEEKLNQVLNMVKKHKNGILYCDEIHNIVGAGSAQGSMDIANLIKPELASGDIRCIGATTYKEFRNIIEKDPALTRRFRKIDITEPSIDDTIKIIMGLKEKYEEHHGVEYKVSAIEKAVELSDKYITGKFNPDKSLDIIDEAGSFAKKNKLDIIDDSLIEDIITKVARIPKKTLNSDYSSKIKNLRDSIKLMIYGQDDAINTTVSALEVNQSGLGDEKKPIGSFLFVGPTGVGKTELVNQLAYNLGLPMTRIDMSEFSEKFTVSKLVGAPPGYVGYDQEGQLTEAVIKNPHSVILLDEIEKAHPDIYNILLQVLDYGVLRDSNNREANFKNSIIIMTSNVGAREASKPALGITSADHELYEKPTKAINDHFSPEFLNRLDKIVYFEPLAKEDIYRVLEKNINQINIQLQDKKVSISLSESVKDFLIEKGYQPKLGARPMARMIRKYLKEKLAPELLHGRLKDGGNVFFDLKGKDLVFSLKKEKVEKQKD